MNDKEKILISKLLDLASDEFSNHGCNDIDEEWFKDWTKEEKYELMESYYKQNNELDLFENDSEITIGDSMLMEYFAKKFREEVKE